MSTSRLKSTSRLNLAAMLALLAAAMLASCGSAGTPDEAAPSTPPTEPAAASGPTSLAEILPEGLGRGLVIDSCGSCHAVACSAIGQPTAARWKALETDHRDRVADMADEDYVALFAYL